MNLCPKPEVLVDFLSGQLNPSDLTQVREHVAICDACQTALDQITDRTSLHDLRELWQTVLRGQGNEETLERALDVLRELPLTSLRGSAQTQSILPGLPDILREPTRIGRYRVERVLGSGGFGVVFLAHDEQLQRSVAIKVPHSRQITSVADADIYLTEARTVANLDHPRIVPVLDLGSTSEFPFFVVSKYIPGCNLKDRLSQSRMSYAQSAELIANVADTLHYAHKQGLVHRDVKPANILLGQDNQVFIVDFGLALRDVDVGTGSRFCGTPAYMSPEQVRGEGHRVDGRSDIFSLGVVFYELLAGHRPFMGDKDEVVLVQIIEAEPRPLGQYDESIPLELERICMKALSKRASERYSTAHDLAEDLKRFLNETRGITEWSRGSTPQTRLGLAGDVSIGKNQSDSVLTTSHREPIKVVPKGLRSFDVNDADFFLELLPGPRDRDGLPDSIRFWKSRIEDRDSDNTFAVGLIYGPSGCGKSSLMKAGILPRLSGHVIQVYIEATANETEARLFKGLHKYIPALSDNISLTSTLTAMRRRQGTAACEKVLIVLDQFEQWLHAKTDQENTELVQALRQCDGGLVQCIVMVRDDFWMSATRFMRELEVRLLEGQNSTAVDLFPIRHAKTVLAAFGRAFGVLPNLANEETPEHKEFVKQAVLGISQEGKVISVKLALFAEMMKGKEWTPATLKKVGGMEGVGVTFLEETFSEATAPPEHRFHQKAARTVLKQLLPEAGTEIKGHMRSHQDLLVASGYASRPNDFETLLHILDSEIRLITPTDPEGQDQIEPSSVQMGAKYYQLTHDYLVSSLRDWLTRKQKETFRGRAELRLTERAALWNHKRENRHLPSSWEYLSAVILVPKKNRFEAQQRMLARAGRVHATRWGGIAGALLMIAMAILHVVSNERSEKLRGQTLTAVDAVQNSRGSIVAETVRNLKKLPIDLVSAELKSRYRGAQEHRKLGLAYALAESGEVDSGFLCSQISSSGAEEVDNFITAFGHDRAGALKAIETEEATCKSERNWRLMARLAVVALHLGHDRIAIQMCRIRDRPDPVQRTIFIDEFPTWHGDLARLAALASSVTDPSLRSALCLGLGSVPSDRRSSSENASWKPVFIGWYQEASDNATHSAVDWTLRQWKVDRPSIAKTKHPLENRDWFVNTLSMTMLKIEPGDFVRSDYEQRGSQTVKLTKTFYLSDREVTMGQFRQYLDDPLCPAAEKPTDLKMVGDEQRDNPQANVSWIHAVHFCNWLSRNEGLIPFYEHHIQENQDRVDGQWQCVATGTGYRLPTEAEWEYACRAGTTTEYSSGQDIDLLRKYAIFTTGSTPGPSACSSRLPNGWGLFDMHGNLSEWCFDFHEDYGTGEICDPSGPTQGDDSNRMVRGGGWDDAAYFCRSAFRDGNLSDFRKNDLGFRIARSLPKSVE